VGSPESSPWVLLTLTGELDMSRTEELDEMVAAAMEGDRIDVIVDLSEVTFMDSSVLRWLLKVQDLTDRVSGRLRLVALDGGSPIRILSLSGLDGRFAVFRTTVEAQGDEAQP
jgi:anti-sigma B factor antagonist